MREIDLRNPKNKQPFCFGRTVCYDGIIQCSMKRSLLTSERLADSKPEEVVEVQTEVHESEPETRVTIAKTGVHEERTKSSGLRTLVISLRNEC